MTDTIISIAFGQEITEDSPLMETINAYFANDAFLDLEVDIPALLAFQSLGFEDNPVDFDHPDDIKKWNDEVVRWEEENPPLVLHSFGEVDSLPRYFVAVKDTVSEISEPAAEIEELTASGEAEKAKAIKFAKDNGLGTKVLNDAKWRVFVGTSH